MEPGGWGDPAVVQGPCVNRDHRRLRGPCIGCSGGKSVAFQSFFGMFVLLFVYVNLEQVGCIRSVQSARNHVRFPGTLVNIRGERRVRDVFMRKGRLPRHTTWLRKLAAGNDFTAVSRRDDKAVCRAGCLWGTRDEKLVAEWRSGKRLSSGHERCFRFAKKDNDKDCSDPTVNKCPSEPVTQDIAKVTYVGASPWPHILTAMAATAQAPIPWRMASGPWQTRSQVFGLNVYYRDAGGGGDCMYLSVAAALLELQRRIPLMPVVDAQTLRRLAAQEIVGHKNLYSNTTAAAPKGATDAFMDRLTILSGLEAGGSWEDGFSPSSILFNNLYTTTRGVRIDTSTPKGKAQALYAELSSPGTPHWGMAMDLEVLEEKLPVGFIVLHVDGYVYPLGTRRDQRKHAYIMLYFRPGHFQQAAIGTSPTTARSAFLADEVPDFIHCIFMVDCHSPLFPIPNLPLHTVSR